jgi:hypothetical protein
MKCKLALGLVIAGILGGAAWAYWDWAVRRFDVQVGP